MMSKALTIYWKYGSNKLLNIKMINKLFMIYYYLWIIRIYENINGRTTGHLLPCPPVSRPMVYGGKKLWEKGLGIVSCTFHGVVTSERYWNIYIFIGTWVWIPIYYLKKKSGPTSTTVFLRMSRSTERGEGGIAQGSGSFWTPARALKY